ncbi:MAG: hypothetical protein A2V88_12560 [Elusimicrobia bacterium RBG_16_66_12]|nr:MAG: hypothetical protein A2V88_12560 [Elusimicrobia bacterium RBG_16_66_12]
MARALATPCAAAPALTADIPVSSAPVRSRAEPFTFQFGFQKGIGSRDRSSIGVGSGLKDGKPLELALWGGGGAVAGSIAGPAGAVVGAAVGAVVGLVVAVFAVPHNGPQPD